MSVEALMMPPRRRHLQRLYRTKSYPSGRFGRKETPPEDKEEGEWCLVGPGGVLHTLPKTMIFLGREECDIEVQSESVDKRHAVITFDHYLRRFKIKDLSTTYGTYVNGTPIPEQEYVTLEKNDSLFLGDDDSVMFKMERFHECEMNGTSQEVDEEEPYTCHHGADTHHHDDNNDDDNLPSWATGTMDSQEDVLSPLKECKGCIVEQRIEHTCGEDTPECETAHRDLDRSLSHESIASFSLGCNTWPKKRYKTKKVSVTDVFDMDNQASRDIDGLIDAPTPAQNRVLRGTGAPMNILPDELATVKKGTPLYGQPEWWGEEDSDLSDEKLRVNGHTMEQEKAKDGGESASVEDQVSVSDNSGDTQSDKHRDKQSDIHSSEPRDTQSDKQVKNGVSDQDSVPNKNEASASDMGATNMAFTIDFGDDISSKGGKTLQELVPSKIRKSFRERKDRQEKTQSLGSGTALSKTGLSKEKTGDVSSQSSKSLGRAVSEGRDISPTHQRSLDEIWNSNAITTPESAASRRHAMAKHKSSSHSQELDDDQAENSYAKPTKSSAVKRRSHTNAQSKPKSVIRARKAVSQEVLASSTQYTNDNASYLIDKMFQNNSTGSVDNLKSRNSRGSATECDLYSEAIKYDSSKSKSESQDLSSIVRSDIKRDRDSGTDRGTHDIKTRSGELSVALPVVETSQMDTKTKDDEDKVSEAGTYTIESDKESKAADEARKNIDKVFGVDQVSVTSSASFSDLNLKSPKSEELQLNLQNINDELEELEKLEKLRRQRPLIDSLEGELGSVDENEIVDSEENPSSTVPSDAPAWVTQWAALTNHKPQNQSGDMELSSPGSSVSDDKDGKPIKTSNGLSRKRPGTGRRLPTIPPGATSPALSDNSVTKESPAASKCDLAINGTASQMLQQTPKQRSVKISSHVASRYQDTDSESVSLTKYNDTMVESAPNTGGRSKRSSGGSVASLDTDVLLKDTATVMAAIEKRVGSKPKRSSSPERLFVEREKKTEEVELYSPGDSKFTDICGESVVLNESIDGESDTSSVVACVNGDEDYVKPTHYKSPRDVLGKGRLKLAESLPSKPSVHMTGAKSKRSESVKDRKRSVEESRSVVSDTLSEVNGVGTNGVENTDAQFSRQGSRGKGQISMTRPNRAFALRRARADSDEVPDTARTTSSVASSGMSSRGSSMTNLSKSSTPQKVKRPLSGKYTDRQPESSRSQASLGAQIVQKSRDNANNSFTRTDGGRHSLRTTRSMSIPAQQPGTPTHARARKSDVAPSSSQLNHSRSLRVTGVGARERSSSVSKASSRTNSPKSAERNAWKRRKDYDPRKAVAEAKIKDSTRRKSREMDSYLKNRGITRSASFTNAKDLKLSAYGNSQGDSTSSAHDYSRTSSEASDVFDDGPKRGFVPYSVRSVVSSKISNSSVDDEEAERYLRSSSALSSQETSSRPNSSSAFSSPHKPLPLTVFKPTSHKRNETSKAPKVLLKTPSPTPASHDAMSSHRRSVDSLVLYQSALRRKSDTIPRTNTRVPESYDTIIVSSIYQLSLKLRTYTDKTMDKLRDTEMIENGLDSPLDDLDSQSSTCEIPAYKSANQELAGVLKNLRRIEQHIKVMNKVLFPDDETSPDTTKEKHEYMQEIERIRNELAGFQPIDTPREDVWKQTDTASVESDCEELSQAEYY